MTTGWQEHGIDQLLSRVNGLEETVDAVVGQLPSIVEAVAQLDDEVTGLQSERTETGSALSRHDRELRELSAAVKRLSTQVGWIERHIRSTGSAPAVTLDGPDPDLAGLAATAEAGRRAEAQLLSRFARTSLESTVTTHRDALAQQQAAAGELLQACAVLAETDPGDPAHQRSRSSYQRAREALVAAERQAVALHGEAQAGLARLADDDQARKRTRAATTDGEQAHARLLVRVRTKLAAAVGDGAMLPSWLTVALGPTPPADGAQRWMDVAAGVIAYRITYRVEDDEDTLGDLPESAPGHRRRWYEDLRGGIRDLRR